MNKSFVYCDKGIIVSTEKGIRPLIPYIDSVEDILILENEIEFLKKSLESDEKTLSDKIDERKYRLKDVRNVSIFGSGISIGAAFFLSSIMNYGDTSVVNTVFGEMSQYTASVMATSAAGISIAQVIAGLGLTYRPSKKELAGYEEKIIYEQTMIESLTKELSYLREHATQKNKNLVNGNIAHKVHYESSIAYFRDALKLRYAFGANKKRIIDFYYEGTLVRVLEESNFPDDVIMDFMGFIQNRLNEEKEVAKLAKK